MRRLPAPAPASVRCPACGGAGLTDVFEVDGLPVFVGMLQDDRERAKSAPRGDVTLAWCPSCAFVHNRRHDPARVDFRPGYEVSLSHSPTFRDYIHGVADRLVDRHGLAGRRVLEIGCGDGYFLRLLAERGVAEATGIDPTVARVGDETVGSARVRWIRDYYRPDRYPDLDPDFVACLSVFEDVPAPGEFLRGLRRRLRPEARVYFEVWNASHAFEHQETWSVHYEQCNLFEPASLVGVFERAGFRVLGSGPSYAGGQYCYVEAAPDGEARAAGSEAADGVLPASLERFADRHREDVAGWAARLAAHAAAGRRIALWGSGGKGITFLNGVPGSDAIVAVVDINPDRQGKFIPGTGHPIVSPEAALAYAPDVIVLTNSLYEREIRAQADEIGLRCDFEAA